MLQYRRDRQSFHPAALGENYLEMEDETNATEFLLRAYMLEGEKIFKEDWKYFQWLSGHVNLKQK